MTSLQWGTVSDVIQAATAIGSLLYAPIAAARSKSAASFPSLVEEMATLDAASIQSILDENPQITELVARAWEEAARTTIEDKLKLLAKVAAQTLSATSSDQLDENAFLLRTVGGLEPAHIRLLLLIAIPRPLWSETANTNLEGYFTESDLKRIWPGVQQLIGPTISHLERENLIANRATGTDNSRIASWGLTDYGRLFLDFLPGPNEWEQRKEECELVVRIEGDNAVIRTLAQAMLIMWG